MAPSTAPPKAPKKKTSNGGKSKKLSAFNKYMRTQMELLQETEPELTHPQRFRKVSTSWATSIENPKNAGKAGVAA